MRELGRPNPASNGVMGASAVPDALQERREQGKGGQNPWLSDHVLLNISLWWVRVTQPNTLDFATEVAVVFDSLQHDLRRRGT